MGIFKRLYGMNSVYLNSLFCNQEINNYFNDKTLSEHSLFCNKKINNYFNDKTLSEQRKFQQNLRLLILQPLRIKITEWPAFWNEECG